MSYTVPTDTTLGEVLGLRHNHTPGIATKRNADGTWELTGWPPALGSAPTQVDVDTWAAEVATRRATEKRALVKSALRGNDPDTIRLRAVLKVVLASLVEARTKINDLRAALAAHTSTSDLKSRATAIAALTNRDYSQALSSVDALIDAGQAEE